jgi:peptidoglycan/LPS O-acetylase OafA/YrhL
MQHASALTYRPEIDGLRALAVLPVMLFHADIPGFSGGFVGVDVFFVISGFLIGSIIIHQVEQGSFSLWHFYERRARRILPVLFVVVLCCVPVAWLTLTPSGLTHFAEAMLGTLFFISNIVFWQQTDYFAPSAEENPLLHTWSLAIEEQYYVLFPLMIMAFWRKGLAFNLKLLIWISLSSFLVALWMGHRDASANFFLLPGRIWELLVGVIVAVLLRHRTVPASVPAALAGLVMISIAVVLADDSELYPGPWTLLPVLGSALVIAFARAGNHAARFLSLPPLVAVGLLSYSLYLWHQPLLAFARVIGPTHLSAWNALFLILLSFPMAWLTYRFVETPFRSARRVPLSALKGALIPAALVLVVTGAFFRGGLDDRFSHEQRDLLAELETGTDFVIERFNAQRHDRFALTGTRKVLVVGDSFAQDAVNVLHDARLIRDDDDLVTIIVPGVCQFYLGEEDVSAFRPPDKKALCQLSDDNVARAAQLAREADVIFLAASWRMWGVERLANSIAALALRPDQHLVVFGTKGFEKTSHFSYLKAGDLSALRPPERFPRPAERSHLNKQVARVLDGLPLLFIDWFDYFCDEQTCHRFDENGRLLAFDGSHLTRSGVTFFGQRMAADITRHIDAPEGNQTPLRMPVDTQ